MATVTTTRAQRAAKQLKSPLAVHGGYAPANAPVPEAEAPVLEGAALMLLSLCCLTRSGVASFSLRGELIQHVVRI